MNEMISVATKGSWVMTTMNSSAGSKGARVPQARGLGARLCGRSRASLGPPGPWLGPPGPVVVLLLTVSLLMAVSFLVCGRVGLVCHDGCAEGRRPRRTPDLSGSGAGGSGAADQRATC